MRVRNDKTGVYEDGGGGSLKRREGGRDGFMCDCDFISSRSRSRKHYSGPLFFRSRLFLPPSLSSPSPSPPGPPHLTRPLLSSLPSCSCSCSPLLPQHVYLVSRRKKSLFYYVLLPGVTHHHHHHHAIRHLAPQQSLIIDVESKQRGRSRGRERRRERRREE